MIDPFAPGLLSRLPTPPRKVAVLRASRLGDFVCATPALRALRAALPDAAITLIALPLVRDLALRSPHVDCCVPFPGFPGIAEQFFDAHRMLDFFARMQAERFDLAIQMHGSGVSSNAVALMLGARATAGWVRPADSPSRLDAALPYPTGVHEVRRALGLTTFLGAPPRGARTELVLWPEDYRAADTLLAGCQPPLIGLHPGAREPEKRWPTDRFCKVACGLLHRCGGTVILLGDRALCPAASAIAATLGADRCRDLSGRTPLGTLGAVITRLALLVTNDSGPAHFAYALGTSTVTLFGPTDPAIWGPPADPRFQVVAAPHFNSRDARAPLDAIDAGRVLAAAEAALAAGGASWFAQRPHTAAASNDSAPSSIR